MVTPGQTGFLPTSPGEWAEAARTLAADRGLRRRMGAAAREAVEKDYSVAAWGRRSWRPWRGGPGGGSDGTACPGPGARAFASARGSGRSASKIGDLA